MLKTEIELTRSEFPLFQTLMYEKAGVRLGDHKRSMVQGRLRSRLAKLACESFREYFEYMTQPAHAGEYQECLNALTTNETFFFRHKMHWDYIANDFLAQFRQNTPKGKALRVWSAAASTGDEAYSAAILLYSLMPPVKGWPIQIDATDVNMEVLRQAREGFFDSYALQKMTPLCISKYLSCDSNKKRYQVIPEVRNLVSFSQHNLMHKKKGPCYQIILLRNVMIYFDRESKREVLDKIIEKLNPGGILILGGAESLPSEIPNMKYIKPTIYVKQ